MMKSIRALVFTICIIVPAGCATVVPVKATFPEAPAELSQECPETLLTLPAGAQLSDINKTVVRNYTQYHKCALRNKKWEEWYILQKANYERD